MSTPDIQAAAARWVDDNGECLYRYALVRVRRPEVAEDLVQETFLAGVRGYEKFGGRSSERSWLVGILKKQDCRSFPQARSGDFVHGHGISFR